MRIGNKEENFSCGELVWKDVREAERRLFISVWDRRAASSLYINESCPWFPCAQATGAKNKVLTLYKGEFLRTWNVERIEASEDVRWKGRKKLLWIVERASPRSSTSCSRFLTFCSSVLGASGSNRPSCLAFFQASTLSFRDSYSTSGMVYFGTADTSEKSVRAVAGRLSRT